jgi:hypothetical protein
MAHGPDQSKRRFIKAGLVSVPVVVTLAARPAWAQQPGPTGYVPYAAPGTAPGQAPLFSGIRQVSPTGRGDDLG